MFPLETSQVLMYPKRTLRSSGPSFIQLKRFEKTHIGSICFGAENRPFWTRTYKKNGTGSRV